MKRSTGETAALEARKPKRGWYESSRRILPSEENGRPHRRQRAMRGTHDPTSAKAHFGDARHRDQGFAATRPIITSRSACDDTERARARLLQSHWRRKGTCPMAMNSRARPIEPKKTAESGESGARAVGGHGATWGHARTVMAIASTALVIFAAIGCPEDGGPQCTSDDDCKGEADTPRCVMGACVPLACTTDEGCAPSPGRPHCDTSARLCAACLKNADCGGATPFCNTTLENCVGCLATSDCPTGEFCSGSQVCFVPACASDSACAGDPRGKLCDVDPTSLTYGSCGTVCNANRDCTAPYTCEDQTCVH